MAYPCEGTFALGVARTGLLSAGTQALCLRSESLPLLPPALGLILWNLRPQKEGAPARSMNFALSLSCLPHLVPGGTSWPFRTTET